MSHNYILAANTRGFLLQYKYHLIDELLSRPDTSIVYLVYLGSPRDSQEFFSSRLAQYIQNPKVVFTPLSKPSGLSFYQLLCALVKYHSLLHSLSSTVPCTLITHTSILNTLTSLLTSIFRYPLTIRYVITGLGGTRIRRRLKNRLLLKFYLNVIRHSSESPNTRVLTLNTDDFQLLSDFTSKGQIFCVRESLPSFTPTPNLLESKLASFSIQRPLRLCYLGRFLREKGIHHIPEISRLLNYMHIDHILTLYGTHDPCNSSSLTAPEMSCLSTSSIIVQPATPASEVFSANDILIFPSLREGHPKYLLESITHLCIPIVYPVPGCDVDVIDGYNGLVTQMATPSSMAACVGRVAGDKTLYKNLLEGAYTFSNSLSKTPVDLSPFL